MRVCILLLTISPALAQDPAPPPIAAVADDGNVWIYHGMPFQQVTDDDAYFYSNLKWSPDGRWLAFAAGTNVSDQRLMVVERTPTSFAPPPVQTATLVQAASFDFSLDSQAIYFAGTIPDTYPCSPEIPANALRAEYPTGRGL